MRRQTLENAERAKLVLRSIVKSTVNKDFQNECVSKCGAIPDCCGPRTVGQIQFSHYRANALVTEARQRHFLLSVAVFLLAESNMEKGLSSGTLPFFIFNNLPNTRMIEYHPLNLVRQLLASAGSINSNIQLESSSIWR